MLKQPVMTQKEKDLRFFIEELRSDVCQCERKKQPGRSFCYKCWLRLPEELRRPLYRKIGAGYEAAYDSAYRYLNDL